MVSDRFERVMSVMHREVPDRVPWAIWGHFPACNWIRYYSWEKANRDGEESAKAHLALLSALDYKMDLLKVTPLYRYMATQWGTKIHWTNNDESSPVVEVLVKKSEDWSKLWVLDPRKELREFLRTVEILARDLYGMPFIYTIPSPLSQAMNSISTPEQVYKDMKENPDSLKQGLDIITETTKDFARECIAEGATGIFFGIGNVGRSWRDLTQKQLEEYALTYDKKILNAIDCPIKFMHICSKKEGNPQDQGLMENGWFKQYPVHCINWDAHEHTWIDTGKRIYGDKFAICGGLNRETTLRKGTPLKVEAEVKKAIMDAGEDGGFMVGPGCTVYQDMPRENYNAVGRAVIKYGYYKK